mmetsp:Transcript_13179/g.21474  ORF Transcript_13179/g.21474 Transcript_13179/m.21474 type:complete len:321 (-) Transcript_13179:70-1032(-)
MDPLFSKAQQQLGGASSKAMSKGSARKARSKKKRAPKSQNAGQPSGPGGSVATSERSRSRSAVEEGEDTPRAGGESATGSKVALYTVGALHAIDIGLGLALVIYGGIVHVAQVTGLSIFYGLVLLLGAIAGAIGYYSGACNRRGLVGSAIAGLLTCLLDFCAFIAILVSWDSFIKFLNDNHTELMLSKDSVQTIEGLKILYAIIFFVLAVLEGYRFRAMWAMKDTMQGTSGRVAPLSGSTSDSKWNKFLSWFGLAKRKKTDDFVVFDDNASMESSLLWSKNGAQPTSDDYLEFVPEHERGLADFTSNVALPTPPEDRVDY